MVSILVPFISLVWYNGTKHTHLAVIILVPFISLVWYNGVFNSEVAYKILVPFISLVWYNRGTIKNSIMTDFRLL